MASVETSSRSERPPGDLPVVPRGQPDPGFVERLHPLFRTPGENEPNIAYFVARQGGEGVRWAEEYTLPEHVALMSRTHDGLSSLRARQLEEGRRELREAERLLREARGASPGVYHLLGRWYYGALAYLHYVTEDFAAADEALDRASEEVRRAIQAGRFLLPYASECLEFWIQRVRVARNRRCWPEVRRRLETTRQITAGERPCCVLDDGSLIGFDSLRRFYSNLGSLTPEERRPLGRFLDEESRERYFGFVASEAYSLNGFVIPYHPPRSGPARLSPSHPAGAPSEL